MSILLPIMVQNFRIGCGLWALALAAPLSHGAGITWEPVFPITQASDVNVPSGSVLVEAVDYTELTSFSGDGVINGIPFTQVGVSPFSAAPTYASGYWAATTDDADLDALLDAHAYEIGDPATAQLTLGGLTPGRSYQVQLMGVADSRVCCSAREADVGDGEGNFDTGVVLTRGFAQSVVGHFVASGSTQTIRIRSRDGIVGNSDPGLCGYVLFELLPVSGPRYVNASNATPQWPYTSWSAAAVQIQDAIDAAVPGEVVYVTNGVYATGSRIVDGSLGNRVVITNAVRVVSVNGPGVTTIRGGGPVGDGAIRCAYIGANSELKGFALTGGATRSAGNVNTEQSGGGVWGHTNALVSGCTLIDNTAYRFGGGAYQCRLTACVLSGNRAETGGGAYNSKIKHGTVTLNTPSSRGGGTYAGSVMNSIVYYNDAPSDANVYQELVFTDSGPAFSPVVYTCTTPEPEWDFDSPDIFNAITSEPKLISIAHIAQDSPCVGRGNANYAAGVDVDGEPWRAVPSMGADEAYLTSSGPLLPAIRAMHSTMSVGASAAFVANISGPATATAWEFGDGTIVSNRAFLTHSWDTPGNYTVRLTAWNAGHPAGVSTTMTVQITGVTRHYVSAESTTPQAPFLSWATAATNIQEAINAADRGAHILVSNGVYTTGGAVANGNMVNRVALTNAVSVISVNGPGATTIRGTLNPGTPTGPSAVRCAYVGPDSMLSGFTLTNGATLASGDRQIDQAGGGVWCSAGKAWNEGAEGLVSNCVLVANIAKTQGGGAYQGTLQDCRVLDNSAGDNGGGAYGATLIKCTLTGNASGRYGGGADLCTLRHCSLSDNSAQNGAGVNESTLYHCRLTGNMASHDGGGARFSTLFVCILAGNATTAAGTGGGGGGGTIRSTLYNCTLTENVASYRGGGCYESAIYNSILYDNYALEGYSFFNFNFDEPIRFSCVTPHPGGFDNISADPRFTTDYHVAQNSPCVGRASAEFTEGTDIDGEPWRASPAMGADEPYSPADGNLLLDIAVPYNPVATDFEITIRGVLDGPITAFRWTLGDGTEIRDSVTVTHAWSSPGDYPVVLTAWSAERPHGVSTSLIVHVREPLTRYVDARSTSPQAPYSNWSSAAATLQDAIDAASAGDVILVTNGVYDTGGAAVPGNLLSRVALTNGVHLRSVNGPGVTVIRGAWDPVTTNGPDAVRCAVMDGRSRMSGFTLESGATFRTGHSVFDLSGGGIWCDPNAVVQDCWIVSNAATRAGGGVYQGALTNCVVSDNVSWFSGGGVFLATLSHCTLSGNTTRSFGGGAYKGTLADCILTGNSSALDGGGTYFSTVSNSRYVNNSAQTGGGNYDGSLTSCFVSNNVATFGGGGCAGGWLYNCVITDNTADRGGGVQGGSPISCLILRNMATSYGGGTDGSTVRNCTVVDNTCAGEGGGVFSGVTRNSIVLDNTASDGNNSATRDIHLTTFQYSCTFPDPGGTSNITTRPQFEDAANGDFRLKLGSPCIDAGTEDSRVTTAFATDIAGAPRVIGSSVDIGAHEFRFEADVRIHLADMVAPYGAGMPFPLTSPYASDIVEITDVPNGAVDWALLEIRHSITSIASAVASSILLNDGRVVEPDGMGTVPFNVNDPHHIVVKHRNHLTVISPDIVTTNRVFSYDFTTGPDKAYRGTNAMVLDGSGQWGMIPGDADGDGRITAVDWQIVSNSLSNTGYLQADVNLDGIVTESDLP